MSDSSVEQSPAGGYQLEHTIEVPYICDQDRETQFLRLKEQHAVVQSSQSRISPITLQSTKHTGKQCGPALDVYFGNKKAVARHSLDHPTYLFNRSASARMI